MIPWKQHRPYCGEGGNTWDVDGKHFTCSTAKTHICLIRMQLAEERERKTPAWYSIWYLQENRKTKESSWLWPPFCISLSTLARLYFWSLNFGCLPSTTHQRYCWGWLKGAFRKYSSSNWGRRTQNGLTRDRLFSPSPQYRLSIHTQSSHSPVPGWWSILQNTQQPKGKDILRGPGEENGCMWMQRNEARCLHNITRHKRCLESHWCKQFFSCPLNQL